MKKILIINGEPFQDKTATGITLKNIFFLVEKQYISYIHVSKIQPDFNYLENVFSFYKNSLEIKSENIDIIPNKINKNINAIALIKNELRVWDDLRNVKFSSEIIKYIKESKAEVIYSCLGNLRIISLVLFAQKIIGCPIVPHFMDDWKSVIFSKKRLLIHRLILKQKLNQIISFSKVGVAISEKMAIEYEKEYNIPFYSIMNCIPDEHLNDYQENINKGIKKMIFTGGLHLDRWKSLLLIAQALDKLNIEKKCQLDIYCPESDKVEFQKHFLSYSFVNFMGHIPIEQIKGVLASADILLHCESFDNSIRKYTRLSISTKIPTYLKEAKLVLAFGPKEIESIEYIQRNKAGITISETDINSITRTLEMILSTNSKEVDMIRNGLTLVKRNHTFSSVRNKVEQIFN